MQLKEALIESYHERLMAVQSDTDTVIGLLNLDLQDVPSRHSELTMNDGMP